MFVEKFFALDLNYFTNVLPQKNVHAILYKTYQDIYKNKSDMLRSLPEILTQTTRKCLSPSLSKNSTLADLGKYYLKINGGSTD